MRCLDIGGRDGFYAFHIERLGAAEVVSLDLADPELINSPGRGRRASGCRPSSTLLHHLRDPARALVIACGRRGS